MKHFFILLTLLVLIQLCTGQTYYAISGICTRTDTGAAMMGWGPSGFPPELPLGWNIWTFEYTASVPAGWSGVITPVSSTPGTFSPPSRTYTNVHSDYYNQSYSFTPVTYEISGRITRSDTGQGVAAVLMNGLEGNPMTNANGYYVGNVLSDWSGTVTPTCNQPGSFSPPSRTYANVLSPFTVQDYVWTPVTYAVSGRITSDQTGEGLSGVSLYGLPGTPQTDAAGQYSVNVLSGFSGTVTPSYATPGIFTPLRRIYSNLIANQTEQNYSWSAVTYTISGRITRAGSSEPLSGVNLNGFPASVMTNALGDYTASVPWGFSGQITPAYAQSGSFNPAGRTYNHVTAHQTNQNYAWSVTSTDEAVAVISNLFIAPNPCRTQTSISFCLSKPTPVTIRMYDTKGRCIKTLVNSVLPSGKHNLNWNGTDTKNFPCTNGLYLLHVSTSGITTTHKLLLLRE